MSQALKPPTYATLAEVALLPALLFMILGWPFAQGSELSEQFFEAVFLTIILSAAVASSSQRFRLIPVLAFGIGALVLDTISQDRNPILECIVIWCDLLFAVSLSGVLLLRVFDETGTVTWRVVLNALSVYLLIGLAFGAVYNLLGMAGEVYEAGFGFSQNDPDLRGFATTYFSFVTLTTLGYGDITPDNARIASAAVVQALIGQFYLAVVVARLVSLFAKKTGN
ncbi:potassium channel family protein [Ruegeria sp. SCP11]|uniref:potassium channel family protein n=1 Tax=Ruegeria sp. SCP11 TaxID=3141378 RepID=UPI00333DFB9E